jgi:hypothetical protein
MKLRFFVIVFCILVVVGTASAQRRKWVEVTVSGAPSIVGSWYIDYSSIRRLPGGNVTFWGIGSGAIFQTEVNCVSREYRDIKRTSIVLPRTDSYGNEISPGKVVTSESQVEWLVAVPTSAIDTINGIACRFAKNIASQSDKPVAKKKAVNRTQKRKQ